MITRDELARRAIPFASLRYSTDAFIDYRIPGCAPKYNYALIGPGVSQNPNQPVSLREPHGFQVGGVSMPHGVTNPPHLHFTCEVFICVRGEWEIHWGFNPDARTARIQAGDIVSVPTWIYRGFRNIGDDNGFLFTALGGDDTGGILWGPQTLAAAAEQGVYLTEDYRIIDEQLGHSRDPDTRLLQPMTASEIAALRDWSEADMATRVARGAQRQWSRHGLLDSALPGHGAQIAGVIGHGMRQDRDAVAPIANAHGLSMEWLRIPAGGRVGRHRVNVKQVYIVWKGSLEATLQADDGPCAVSLTGRTEGWDSYAMPAGIWRELHNPGATDVELLVLSSGDDRIRPQWDDTVVAAAAACGLAVDANGYVAPKPFVDRSQR